MNDDIFEQLAKSYDTPERVEVAEIILEKVRRELEGAEGKRLIDYGSGTGLIGLGLSDLVESVLLVDASEQMSKMAEAKIERDGMQKAKTLVADFTKEDPGINADIILVSLVLLHIPDTKRILQSFSRVLGDGGELIIVDFDKNENVSHPKVHSGFDQEELECLLQETGFAPVKMETFHHGENMFMKQDASLLFSKSIKELEQ
ncbi:class I SAM-dependent methyltransferase [Salimicrobium sp. PL1-032A]|uniref:class I SAM-dependent methyltransferase n=1 Tax=Salimicrobium sp. PL1-032A TaxID=3095364 RepID=UPI0032608FC3